MATEAPPESTSVVPMRETTVSTKWNPRLGLAIGLIAISCVCMAFSAPATPRELRAIYLGCTIFFGGQALLNVRSLWRQAMDGEPGKEKVFKSRPMQVVDGLLGIGFSLFFDFFSKPLFVVVIIDLIGAMRQSLTGT